ncbi:MAG TPA: hypothetical protein PKA64_21105, partial [Myxococcota bacterium]|nr:hypothetical protein [Myxococcota bacterium]
MSEPARRGLHPAWHVVQVVVYAFTAQELWKRFWMDASAFGLAAGLQLAAAAASRERPALYRGLNLASAVIALAVYGRFVLQAAYVVRSFGEMAGDAAWAALASGALALPWLFAIPLLAVGRLGSRDLAGLVVLLPVAAALRPYPALASGFGEDEAQNAARGVARGLWGAMTGRADPVPGLPPEALVVITPWSDGKPLKSRCVHGDEVSELAGKIERPPGRGGLVVDVGWRSLPGGYMVAGRDAPLRDGCPPSATSIARSMGTTAVAPGLWAAYAPGGAVRFASAVASDDGVTDLRGGWSRGPDLDADTIRASVREAAGYAARNMDDQGRFAYVIEGPSGARGKGYNYPRHAGTIWFLARAAEALDDEAAGEAADRAIDHVARLSRSSDDGRRFIADPTRKDGRVWVGTTALAAMGAAVRGTRPEVTSAWLRHVAGAVDEE